MDETADIICGIVTSLSPFAVFEENVQPLVGAITTPIDPVPVNTEISVSATFTDPNVSDTHTAVWDWGDGNTSEGDVDETGGSGSVGGIHSYTTAGVYTITLTVTDNHGAFGEAVSDYVVVYDSSAGFVIGGGWIDSPVGAYADDPDLTGKANFGFVSRYEKGATTPSGQTEFNFSVADMNFHSEEYQWLVVAGSQAKFKGDGTINGLGNYGFMLSAVDAALTSSTDVDLFRIKIWDKDNNDVVVYDNQMGEDDDAEAYTQISGGSIVIHEDGATAAPALTISTPSEPQLDQNYPNPFNPETWIPYTLKEGADVTVSIYSATGQLVRRLDLGYKNAGSYTSMEKAIHWDGTNEHGERVSSGLYFYTIQAGEFTATKKMIIAE